MTFPSASRRRSGSFDLRGAVLLSGFTTSVLLLVMCGYRWGATSPLTITLLVLAVAFGTLWATTAIRTRSPVVNVRSFRQRGVIFAHLAAIGVGYVTISNVLMTSLLLQRVNDETQSGWDPIPTTLVLVPQLAALVFVPIVAVLLARALGERSLLVIGALIALAGCALRLYAAPTGMLSVVWALVVTIGVSLVLGALPLLLNKLAPAPRIGALNGMNWTMYLYGAAIAAAVVVATSVPLGDELLSQPSWQSLWVLHLGAATVSVGIVACGVLIPLPDRDPTMESSRLRRRRG